MNLPAAPVRGVAWSAMILASSLGPLPLALSIDYWGSYTPALSVFLTLPVCSAAIVWTARTPTRRIPDANSVDSV